MAVWSEWLQGVKDSAGLNARARAEEGGQSREREILLGGGGQR